MFELECALKEHFNCFYCLVMEDVGEKELKEVTCNGLCESVVGGVGIEMLEETHFLNTGGGVVLGSGAVVGGSAEVLAFADGEGRLEIRDHSIFKMKSTYII